MIATLVLSGADLASVSCVGADNNIQAIQLPHPVDMANMAAYWSGFLLIADGLLFLGRRKTAWALLLVGAFPFFIRDDAAPMWLAACGLIFWHRVRHRRLSLLAIAALVLLLAAGASMQPRTVFAIGPLLIYAFAPVIRDSRAREWLTFSLAVGLFAGLAGILIDDYPIMPSGSGGGNPSVWAPAWLAAGLFFMFLTRGMRQDETQLAARCLALSAALHAGATWVAGTPGGSGGSCWSALALAVASILVAGARFRP